MRVEIAVSCHHLPDSAAAIRCASALVLQQNRTVLAGRYGTCFRSAFGVRTPIAADRIAGLSIVGNEIEMPEAEVSIYEIT
jgi:hypothetical protein